MHNILTPRGALVRDPHVWSHYLNEAIELFGEDTDVLFSVHHWPRWGQEQIVDYLKKQRDLYAYLHDQTLRLLNQGMTGREIAETLELPPQLAREWHCRGYYGSVSHNVKAVYQRYMGWFDGNPAHLWEHTPVESARRYVEFMGGAEAVLERARRSFEEGDYRWVAEVVNHVVFAEPENAAARELQADALEQLGYGAENAVWRNFFLMGAQELREGNAGTPVSTSAPDILAQLTVEQLLDAMAIRLDGPRAAETAADDQLGGHRPRRGPPDRSRERRLQPPPRPPPPGGRRDADDRTPGAERAAAENRRPRGPDRVRPPQGRRRPDGPRHPARPARPARPRLRDRHPGLVAESRGTFPSDMTGKVRLDLSRC